MKRLIDEYLEIASLSKILFYTAKVVSVVDTFYRCMFVAVFASITSITTFIRGLVSESENRPASFGILIKVDDLSLLE